MTRPGSVSDKDRRRLTRAALGKLAHGLPLKPRELFGFAPTSARWTRNVVERLRARGLLVSTGARSGVTYEAAPGQATTFAALAQGDEVEITRLLWPQDAPGIPQDEPEIPEVTALHETLAELPSGPPVEAVEDAQLEAPPPGVHPATWRVLTILLANVVWMREQIQEMKPKLDRLVALWEK